MATESVKIREFRPRGYGASIALIVAALLIIYGTFVDWIEFEGTGIEWNLHDYDDFASTHFGEILVALGIILIILAVISLLPSEYLKDIKKTFLIIRVSAIIVSILAFFAVGFAVSDINDTFGEYWFAQGGLFITFFGSILAIISSAFLKGPQMVEAIVERVVGPAATPTTTPPETKEPSVPKETVKEQIICKNCNKSSPKTSQFCRYCGTRLHENTTQ